MNKSFSVKEALLYSVNALFEHPWYFLKLFLKWVGFAIVLLLPIMALIGLMALLGASAAISGNIVLFIILGTAFLLVYLLSLVYIWCAPIKLLLKFYDTDSDTISFGDFFRLFSFSKLFRVLGLFVLYGIIVSLGLILLIIPGIYLAIKLQLGLYYVIDKNISITEAFRRSYAATTGNFWRIFLADVIAAICMQLIITVPISYLMGVYIYRKLG